MFTREYWEFVTSWDYYAKYTCRKCLNNLGRCHCKPPPTDIQYWMSVTPLFPWRLMRPLRELAMTRHKCRLSFERDFPHIVQDIREKREKLEAKLREREREPNIVGTFVEYWEEKTGKKWGSEKWHNQPPEEWDFSNEK